MTDKSYREYLEKRVFDGQVYKERDGVFYLEDPVVVVAAPPGIRAIDFPEAEAVADCAFSECSQLSSANLPYIRFIGKWGFSHCSKLKTFPSMSNVVIMEEGAFCGSGLETVDLSSVLNISFAAFSSCRQLETIKFSDSLRSIGFDAFAGCQELSDVTLPDTLKTIGQYAFFGTAIKEISIPSSGIKDIKDGVFACCEELCRVDLPDTVERIGDCAFVGCPRLEQIYLPSSVKVIHKQAFSTSLKTIICPEKSYAAQWAKENGFAVEYR